VKGKLAVVNDLGEVTFAYLAYEEVLLIWQNDQIL